VIDDNDAGRRACFDPFATPAAPALCKNHPIVIASDRIDEASCISGFAQRHAPADDAGGVLSEPGAKRMRAANFCDADKTLLVNILGGPTMCDDTKTYMSVVDCKEIDRSTMDKKNQAWSEVTHAFNANSYVQRSTEQLQSLWKKLKMRAKKCATSDMRQPPFDLLLNGKQHIAQQCHVLASRLCRLVCIGNLAALISAAR